MDKIKSYNFILFAAIIQCWLFFQPEISFSTVHVDSKQITSLHTEWKVKKGDNLYYGDPGLNDTDWDTIKIPGNQMGIYPEYRGISWYRINLIFNNNRNISYILSLGKINDVNETYFNGKLIGKTGNIDDDNSHRFDKSRYYTIPSHLIRKDKNILAIRVRDYLRDSAGLLWGNYTIGPAEKIENQRILKNSIDAVFIAIYLCIFFYFFFFSLFPNHLRKQQRSLAFLSLSFSVYLFCVNQLKYLFFDNFILFHKIQYISGTLIVIFSIILLRSLFEEKITLLDKILFLLMFMIIIAVIAIPEVADLTIPRYLGHSTILYACTIFIIKLFTHSFRRYLPIHLGFMLLFMMCFMEILRSYSILPDFDYIRVGLLALVTTISFFIAVEVSQAQQLEKKIRITLEKELDEQTKLVYERNNIIEQDLTIARKIQSKLLPKKNDYPDFINLFSYYQPIDTVGGDFFDLNKEEERIQIIIADVTGHGIPGAMLGMITKIAYEYTKGKALNHKEILHELNRVIYHSSVMSFFVTAFLCTIDYKNMTLQYSNGGHIPQILYRKHTDTMIELYIPGKVLGWLPDAEVSTQTIPISSGDRLYLFTDGITESMNNKKELLGETRFQNILQKVHHLPPEEASKNIIRRLNEFADNSPHDDDITLLIIDIVK